MPVTRRALLISNPGEIGQENYCKGVFVDIANYQRFFMAAHGGTWKSAEITVIERPTVAEVRQQVEISSRYDYSVIAFAGHGWFSKPDDATVLTLKKGEQISSRELLKGGAKRTVILDCCREIRNQSALYEQRTKTAALLSRAEQQRSPDPQRCRDKFDQEVTKASESLVVMHSSTPPEESGDDERAGGYYTSSIIGVADGWAAEVAGKGWKISSDVFSTVRAHEAGTLQTQARSAGKQNPYIEKPRTSGTYFPFSVFA